MRKRKILGIGVAVIVAGLYLNNASWIAGAPDGEATLISHRGVHQTFHRENLTNDTCTAERIYAPTHSYIENTIESFRAAADAGAAMIELDIHPTTDGEFVVFHDWTLDCRTNGSGKTRDHSHAELKALDIGYGYTADGGQIFPLRGQYIGAMPILREVLDTYPDIHFIINFKSRSIGEAQSLLEYVPPAEWDRLSVSGHPDPVGIVTNARPSVVGLTRPAAKSCVKSYVLTGWTGRVPQACHNSYMPVPANYRRLMWGWPHKFEKRLNKVDSRSLLMGDLASVGSTGIDSAEDFKRVPKHYTGMIWSNKVEVVGPLLKSRVQSSE